MLKLLLMVIALLLVLLIGQKVSQKGMHRLREHHARVPGHFGDRHLVSLERRVQLIRVPDASVLELRSRSGHGSHTGDQWSSSSLFILDLLVVGLDHGKDQIDLALGVHVDVRLLHDLDLKILQHLVVKPLLPRFAELGNLAGAVVPEAHGVDVRVLVQDIVEKVVLGVEGVDLEIGLLGGALYPGDGGGFCGDDVEIQLLGLHHADQAVAVEGPVAAGEENGEAGRVADREFDLVDLMNTWFCRGKVGVS